MINVVVVELRALGRILEQPSVKDRPPLVVMSMDMVAVHEVSPYWDPIAKRAKNNK
jgi:hypothetical protein